MEDNDKNGNEFLYSMPSISFDDVSYFWREFFECQWEHCLIQFVSQVGVFVHDIVPEVKRNLNV